MNNKVVRIKMMEYNMKVWQLAKLMKVSEMTVYRRLREELPKEEQNRIIDLIENAGVESDERKQAMQGKVLGTDWLLYKEKSESGRVETIVECPKCGYKVPQEDIIPIYCPKCGGNTQQELKRIRG